MLFLIKIVIVYIYTLSTYTLGEAQVIKQSLFRTHFMQAFVDMHAQNMRNLTFRQTSHCTNTQ